MTSSPSTALVRGLRARTREPDASRLLLAFAFILLGSPSVNATPPKIELITRLEDGQYSNAIRLSWTVPATGINYIYNVLGRFTPAAGGAVAFDANTTSNFFTRTGLQPGTQFQVTVRAIDLTDVDPVGPWSPPAISSTRAGGSFTLTVSSISPSIGPLEGNTTVDFTFSVGTFDISTIVPAVIVTFTFSDNTKSDVSGTWISASQFSVNTPPNAIPGEAKLAVSIDARQTFPTTVVFRYYVSPNVTRVLPPPGVTMRALSQFIIEGVGFFDPGANLIRNRYRYPSQKVSDAGLCDFMSTTQLRCFSPAAETPGDLAVEISFNAQQFSNGTVSLNVWDSSRAPIVTSVFPGVGRLEGGLLVTVTGTNFGATGGINRCKFGDQVSPATWISSTRLTCSTPKNYPTAGMASLEVSNGDLHTDGSELYSSSGVLFGFAPKMNPLLSALTGTGLTGSTAGEYGQFRIVAVDNEGQPIIIGGEQFLILVMSYPVNSSTPTVFYGDFMDMRNGTYLAQYRTTIAGVSLLRIYNALDDLAASPVAPTAASVVQEFGSAFDSKSATIPASARLVQVGADRRVTIVPNIVGIGSSVFGDGLATGRVNILRNFTIQTRDTFGNLRPATDNGKDTFLVRMVCGAAEYFPTVKFVFGGLYSVTYKISRMGIYQTHIALNSFENPIKGSPFTTEIYAQTNSWTRMTTKNTPPARSGHSSVVLDKTKMCIFGGWTMDDIWCYDLTTDEWSELSQLPYYQEMQTVAYKRGSHSALVWNNQMYVFGGHLGYVSATQFEMTEKGTTMRDATNSTVQLRIVQNDLWVYNFTTDRKNGTWTRRWPRNADDPVNGPLPAPRHGHASAILDSGKIIIFGGRGSGFTSEMNDTWEYDIESNRWRELRCSLNDTRYPVKKVSGASMSVIGKRKVLVYGGHTTENIAGSRISSELYMLDLDLCVWYRMQQPAAGSSNRPKALYHHATVTYHLDTKYPKMVLFGGSFGVTNDTKELWLYEHCGGTYGVWAPLSPVPDAGAEDETGRYKPAYGPPSERHKHSLVLAELLGPKILLFGAYTYSVQANDIWAFTPDDRESYGCKDQGY